MEIDIKVKKVTPKAKLGDIIQPDSFYEYYLVVRKLEDHSIGLLHLDSDYVLSEDDDRVIQFEEGKYKIIARREDLILKRKGE